MAGASTRSMGASLHRFVAKLKGYFAAPPPENLTYERCALRLLQRERALDLATLIERVAAEMMHAAKIDGGAALDVGVWGPSVFHMEADAAIRRMIGTTLVLEADGPWMLVAPTTRSLYHPAPQRLLPGARVPATA